MELELAGDEAIRRADEMQRLDDVAIAGHGAARGETDGERHGGQHQHEKCRCAAPTTTCAIVSSRCIQAP